MVAALLTSFLVARGLKSWAPSLPLVSTAMVESSMVTGWQWEALRSYSTVPIPVCSAWTVSAQQHAGTVHVGMVCSGGQAG